MFSMVDSHFLSIWNKKISKISKNVHFRRILLTLLIIIWHKIVSSDQTVGSIVLIPSDSSSPWSITTLYRSRIEKSEELWKISMFVKFYWLCRSRRDIKFVRMTKRSVVKFQLLMVRLVREIRVRYHWRVLNRSDLAQQFMVYVFLIQLGFDLRCTSRTQELWNGREYSAKWSRKSSFNVFIEYYDLFFGRRK